jgi:hypothetical protein
MIYQRLLADCRVTAARGVGLQGDTADGGIIGPVDIAEKRIVSAGRVALSGGVVLAMTQGTNRTTKTNTTPTRAKRRATFISFLRFLKC